MLYYHFQACQSIYCICFEGYASTAVGLQYIYMYNLHCSQNKVYPMFIILTPSTSLIEVDCLWLRLLGIAYFHQFWPYHETT